MPSIRPGILPKIRLTPQARQPAPPMCSAEATSPRVQEFVAAETGAELLPPERALRPASGSLRSLNSHSPARGRPSPSLPLSLFPDLRLGTQLRQVLLRKSGTGACRDCVAKRSFGTKRGKAVGSTVRAQWAKESPDSFPLLACPFCHG